MKSETENAQSSYPEQDKTEPKRKHQKVESDDSSNKRDRADSEGRLCLQNVPEGVCFLSIMNKKCRFFLPSTKNVFDGFKVSKILCDSGCSTILLPIESKEHLKEIFTRFSETCEFSYKKGKGVGGHNVSLVVKYLGSKQFDVELCTDVMGNASKNITIPELRFHLSSEDIQLILNTPHFKSKFAKNFVNSMEIEHKIHERRTHGLLGQHISKQLLLIRHKHSELYINLDDYVLPTTKSELVAQINELSSQLTFFPEGYDDWEDDDFAFEDDEYNCNIFCDD